MCATYFCQVVFEICWLLLVYVISLPPQNNNVPVMLGQCPSVPSWSMSSAWGKWWGKRRCSQGPFVSLLSTWLVSHMAQLPTRLPPQRPKGKPLANSAWPGWRNDRDGAWKKKKLQTVETAKAAWTFGSCGCNMSFWIQNPKLHRIKGEEKEWNDKTKKKNKKGRETNKRRSSHPRTVTKSTEKQGHSASNSCPYAKSSSRPSLEASYPMQEAPELKGKNDTTISHFDWWGPGILVVACNNIVKN